MANHVNTFLAQANENISLNVTERPPSTPEGMAVAYGSLVIMALLPIFFGSYRSVVYHKEKVGFIYTRSIMIKRTFFLETRKNDEERCCYISYYGFLCTLCSIHYFQDFFKRVYKFATYRLFFLSWSIGIDSYIEVKYFQNLEIFYILFI